MLKNQTDNAKAPRVNQDESAENGEHENGPQAEMEGEGAMGEEIQHENCECGSPVEEGNDLEDYRLGSPVEVGAIGGGSDLENYGFEEPVEGGTDADSYRSGTPVEEGARWGGSDVEDDRFKAPVCSRRKCRGRDLEKYRCGVQVEEETRSETQEETEQVEAAATQDEERPSAASPPPPEAEQEAEAYLEAQVETAEGRSGGYLDLNDGDLDSDYVDPMLEGCEWWQSRLASVRQRLAALHIHGKLYDLTLVFPKYRAQIKVG